MSESPLSDLEGESGPVTVPVSPSRGMLMAPSPMLMAPSPAPSPIRPGAFSRLVSFYPLPIRGPPVGPLEVCAVEFPHCAQRMLPSHLKPPDGGARLLVRFPVAIHDSPEALICRSRPLLCPHGSGGRSTIRAAALFPTRYRSPSRTRDYPISDIL